MKNEKRKKRSVLQLFVVGEQYLDKFCFSFVDRVLWKRQKSKLGRIENKEHAKARLCVFSQQILEIENCKRNKSKRRQCIKI